MRTILTKLQAHSQLEAVIIAAQLGLVTIEQPSHRAGVEQHQ